MTPKEILDNLKELEINSLNLRKEIAKLKQEVVEKQVELDDLIIDIKYDIILTDEYYNSLDSNEKLTYLQKKIKDNIPILNLTNEINKLNKQIQDLEFNLEMIYVEMRYYQDLLNFGLYENEE